jgi:hypothetical protein
MIDFVDNVLKIKLSIDTEFEIINWNKIKTLFKENRIPIWIITAINTLRKAYIKLLFKRKRHDAECYMEFGSENLISDLDFTYIPYDKPDTIVPELILFYNDFYENFGDYPNNVFDTNFYICNTMVKTSCFVTIKNPNTKNLFMPESHLFYRLFYKSLEYVKHDNIYCFTPLEI